MKRLSIITICYNEPNLEQTCKTIVNQTWQDFEWIVIDGGSNQETQKIWDKYKYRIDKFVSEPDNGIYNACNKGIKLAKGEFLNFMNAGDCYTDNTILEKIFKNKKYKSDILYGDEYLVSLDGSTRELFEVPKVMNIDFLMYSSLRHQSSFIKRKLFKKFGLYNERYKIVSDWEKWLLFVLKNIRFEYIPYVVANFDRHGQSNFDNELKQLHLEEREQVLSMYDTQIIKFRERKQLLNQIDEQLFSVKNNDTHKTITILGIHINIRKRTR